MLIRMITITTNAIAFWQGVTDKKPIYIYAASYRGELIGDIIKQTNIPFAGYIDRDSHLSGSMLNGTKIYTPNEFKNRVTTDFYHIILATGDVNGALSVLEKINLNIKVLIPEKRNDFNLILTYCRNKQLNNKKFSIISNNCTAGFFYKALGMEFTSPTWNLIIKPNEYPKFCSNIKYYLSTECQFSCYNRRTQNLDDGLYPIGKLDDIYIHFVHYRTWEDAIQAWNRRKERVYYDNLFFVFDENADVLPKKAISDFINLPHKNKVVFQRKVMYNLPYTIFTEKSINPFAVDKLYEEWFDLVGWINGDVEY